MYHIRLAKALSYSGNVRATKKNPDVYVKTEAEAKAAVDTGFFVLVDEPEEKLGRPENADDAERVPFEDEETEERGKTLEDMNKSELETFATYYDVDIKGLKTKADIIERLKEVLPGDVTEGKVTYGSPTIQELQEEIGE